MVAQAPGLGVRNTESGPRFGLDVENPTAEVIDQLATRLRLHVVAVENSKQFVSHRAEQDDTSES